MKTIKIILLVLLVGQILSAQPYQSYFGKEFTRWYRFEEIYDYYGASAYEVANEDTIIGGKTYKKSMSGYPCCFREESETGKLYLMSFSEYDWTNKEFLISDMTLQVGDTFRLPQLKYDGYPMDINGLEEDSIGHYTIVDSVYYEENDGYSRKHIRTQMSYTYGVVQSMEFIEGIGPNFGFIFGINNQPSNISLSSFVTCYETEDTFWKNDKFWQARLEMIPVSGMDCIQNGDNIELINKSLPLKIKQDIERITISFEESISGKIFLYDLLGKTLITKEILKDNNVSIPLAGIPQGSYLLCVLNNAGKLLTAQKIIKKK